MCAPTFGSISLPREMLTALDCTYWLEQMKHVQDIVAVLSHTGNTAQQDGMYRITVYYTRDPV